jgi:hypothetical protein
MCTEGGHLKISLKMENDPGFSSFSDADQCSTNLIDQEMVQIVLSEGASASTYKRISVTPSNVVQVSEVTKAGYNTTAKPPEGNVVKFCQTASRPGVEITKNSPWGGWSVEISVPPSMFSIGSDGAFEANFFRVYMPWGKKGSCPWPPTNDCEYAAWYGKFPSTEDMAFKNMVKTTEGGVARNDEITIGTAVVIAWMCVTICCFMGTSMSTSDTKRTPGSTKDSLDSNAPNVEIEMNAEREIRSPLQGGKEAATNPTTGDGYTAESFRAAGVRQSSEAGEEDFSIDQDGKKGDRGKGGRAHSLDVEEI